MATAQGGQDALAIAQNGGLSGQAADDADLDDTDDGLDDDDMMDKISSSPSIEDGGSSSSHNTLPSLFSPGGLDGSLSPLTPCHATASSPTSTSSTSDARSSSPYLEHPEYLPLDLSDQRTGGEPPESPGRCHHLLHGELLHEPMDGSSGDAAAVAAARPERPDAIFAPDRYHDY